MARRRRTSPAEDFMDLIVMLPWWVGVALAVVFYLWLHHVAGQQVVVTGKPGEIGAMVSQTIWKTLADFGQWILPVLCLAGAAGSAWKQRERSQLFSDVAQSKAADVLDGMTWQEFEMVVGESFRREGYRVAETGGGGADGGVDLELSRMGEKFFVQCKQWKAYKVGVDVVRELYGVMAARGAVGGFVVTSGRYSEDAKSFASGRNIRLIEGPELLDRIRRVRSSAGEGAAQRVEPQPAATPEPAAAISTPDCPVCSRSMVKRRAKKGANAGGEFWGCSAYPACRGIRQIES